MLLHLSCLPIATLVLSVLVALILFSVLALSLQLPQPFGTPFLTQSVLSIGLHSTLFGATIKTHLFPAAFNPLAANCSASDSFM